MIAIGGAVGTGEWWQLQTWCTWDSSSNPCFILQVLLLVQELHFNVAVLSEWF